MGYITKVFVLLIILASNTYAFTNELQGPLHEACENGDVELVTLLIERDGADVNLKTNAGFTPLHYTVLKGYVELATLLIKEHNAMVSVQDIIGGIPLHYVDKSSGNGVELARLLLENGPI